MANGEFSPEDKLTLLEKLLDRQLSWVSAAETRLALTVPLGTALFGTVAAKVPGHPEWDCFSLLVVGLTLAIVSLSIFFSAMAVLPRVKGPKHSVIFFGCITNDGLEKFRENIAKSNCKGYLDDLTEQVFINASIATTKYWYVKRSIVALLASLAPWAISISILYGGV